MRCRDIVGMLLVAGAVAACSSGEPPNTQIGAGNQAIESAERVGAIRFAPQELQSARDKMAEAERAVREEDYERARRLAEQATADAELAAAKAQAERTQQAATMMEEGQGQGQDRRAPPMAGSTGRTAAPPTGSATPTPGTWGSPPPSTPIR